MTDLLSENLLKEREAKQLPVWAQNELMKLRRNQNHLAKRLAESNTNPVSRVMQNPYADIPTYLPDRAVRFQIGIWDDWADVKLIDVQGTTQLEVACSTRLAIIPQVSNVIGIQLASR